MNKPCFQLRPLTVRYLLGGSFLGVIVILVLMAPIEQALLAASPYGVMELEFMWRTDQASRILEAWGPDLIARQLFSTYLDFLFIPCYVTLFVSAQLLVMRACLPHFFPSNQDSAEKPHRALPAALLVAPIFAGICDTLENLGIIYILTNPEHFLPGVPLLVSIAASIKFFLLGLAMLLILIQSVVLLLRLCRRWPGKMS